MHIICHTCHTTLSLQKIYLIYKHLYEYRWMICWNELLISHFLQASMDGQVMATQQYKKLLGSPPAPILGFRFVIPICYSYFFKLQVPNWLFQHFSNWIFSQIWCGFCHQNPQLHSLIVFVSWFVCFCSEVHSLKHPLEICLKRLFFFFNFPTVAYFPLKGNTVTIMSAIKK